MYFCIGPVLLWTISFATFVYLPSSEDEGNGFFHFVTLGDTHKVFKFKNKIATKNPDGKVFWPNFMV